MRCVVHADDAPGSRYILLKSSCTCLYPYLHDICIHTNITLATIFACTRAYMRAGVARYTSKSSEFCRAAQTVLDCAPAFCPFFARRVSRPYRTLSRYFCSLLTIQHLSASALPLSWTTIQLSVTPTCTPMASHGVSYVVRRLQVHVCTMARHWTRLLAMALNVYSMHGSMSGRQVRRRGKSGHTFCLGAEPYFPSGLACAPFPGP